MNEDLNISSPNTVDSNCIKYSTDETVIGEWIDGKPVYRKVYSFNSVSVTGTLTAMVDVTDLNINKLISMKGTCKTSGSNSVTDVNCYYNGNGDYFMTYLQQGKKIAQRTNISEMTNQPSIVVLEYTKTTD